MGEEERNFFRGKKRRRKNRKRILTIGEGMEKRKKSGEVDRESLGEKAEKRGSEKEDARRNKVRLRGD